MFHKSNLAYKVFSLLVTLDLLVLEYLKSALFLSLHLAVVEFLSTSA